jgi:ubiquinone/menaquinone biosynthesis C-methylase UbiE
MLRGKMQAYGHLFAQTYNEMRWSAFAKRVAPLILDFYAPLSNKALEDDCVLDLCCGTGQLAVHFLNEGYKVVGIDLSRPMLQYAEENAKAYLESGRAKFIHADASEFEVEAQFGLVVSTYDSLNHLKDQTVLKKCFQRVFAVNENLFIFDLNTQSGLTRWNSIVVDDNGHDSFIVTHGIYDGQSERALMRLSGFILADEGLYARFDETVFNTVFEMQWVKETLLEIGWKNVYFARVHDLKTPILEPEKEGKVFIIASKF